MAKQAVRQRAALAMGESAGIPKPSGRPRFKSGGGIDKTEYQNYGNGFRRAPAKKSGRNR